MSWTWALWQITYSITKIQIVNPEILNKLYLKILGYFFYHGPLCYWDKQEVLDQKVVIQRLLELKLSFVFETDV